MQTCLLPTRQHSIISSTKRQGFFRIQAVRPQRYIAVLAGESDTTTDKKQKLEQSAPAPAADIDDFEARLAKFEEREGGKPKPRAQAAKAQADSRGSLSAIEKKPPAPKKPKYDFSNEVVKYEGPPSVSDLVLNVVIIVFLITIPLSIAAIARYVWTRYRITDKRVSISKNSPFGKEQADVAYQEIEKVEAIGRGLAGDMVITLRNQNKVELQSLPKWIELRDYIEERVATLSPDAEIDDGLGGSKPNTKGFG